MSLYHYAILLSPMQHRNAINRVLNLLWNDEGDNLGRYASPNGALPATHTLGGIGLSTSGVAAVHGLATTLPTPPGGWPYAGVTEQEAQAAVAALYINVNSGSEDYAILAAENMATVMAAKGLQLYEEPI
jgi:hypothetical protein